MRKKTFTVLMIIGILLSFFGCSEDNVIQPKLEVDTPNFSQFEYMFEIWYNDWDATWVGHLRHRSHDSSLPRAYLMVNGAQIAVSFRRDGVEYKADLSLHFIEMNPGDLVDIHLVVPEKKEYKTQLKLPHIPTITNTNLDIDPDHDFMVTWDVLGDSNLQILALSVWDAHNTRHRYERNLVGNVRGYLFPAKDFPHYIQSASIYLQNIGYKIEDSFNVVAYIDARF